MENKDEKNKKVAKPEDHLDSQEEPHYLSLAELTPQAASPSGGSTNISTVKKEDGAFMKWLRVHCPWLFNIGSLFFFAFFVIFVAMIWCGYSLLNNHFTQLYGWDYSTQYVTFYYDFYDCWHTFFKTGQFVLYDHQTFFGTDNIGSNSYYGLFDPFVVAMIFFPRVAIPQMVAIMTIAKVVVSAFCMRAYLKYMGIKEGTARVGALAFAFSGYMNFMVGFPTTVAACTWIPLILLGIEKVIKEKKPSYLIWGLFLEGITSFFFLVVICIWGVIYALWRYLWTIRSRSLKDNGLVIAVGIGSFAVGLMLCAWTLLPSIRESSLSGRTTSIGRAYLDAIVASLQNHDFGSFFGLIFKQVGDNPGRELMGLISFFYPTSGYLYLPLAVANSNYVYDAWTASIFCYTPFIILFFVAIMNSIRKRKWNHLIAVLLGFYLVFTTFAYYFFYAFSGNGYGRWFIILVPEIIYYGCWAFDDRKEQPKWFMLGGTLLSLFGTVLTFILTIAILKNQSFSNLNGMTYWISQYFTADQTSGTSQAPTKLIWYVYYQIALVVIEGGVMVYFRKQDWLWKALAVFVSIEAVVMGNASFVYGSMWPLESFNGGPSGFAEYTSINDRIEASDSSTFYRSYYDEIAGGSAASGEDNFAMGVGYNGTSSFHSLMNFNVYDYAVMLKISDPPSGGVAFGKAYSNASWSGHYFNKRFATDSQLGVKYYVIEKGGYGDYESQNVPFGSVEVPEMETSRFRVFRNDALPSLGHAVNSSSLYKMNDDDGKSVFYDGSYQTVMMAEQKMMRGAIFDDGTVLPENLEYSTPQRYYQGIDVGYSVKVLTTTGDDKYLPSSSASYASEGPAYFINNHASEVSKAPSYYTGDSDHVVLYPTGKWGTPFNNDPASTGAYFDMWYSGGSATRIYMIGQKTDANGNAYGPDVVLNYEYRALDVVNNKGALPLIGLYAPGKVKYITLLGMGGGSCKYPDSLFLHMQDKSQVDSDQAFMKDLSLQNVAKDGENAFTFTTAYTQSQFVVTQIAYDEGWHVYAAGHEIPTYRLDGGFVGFLAPSGSTSYRMEYMTPKLVTGSILFTVGMVIYISYLGYGFVRDARAIEKETALINAKSKDKKKPSSPDQGPEGHIPTA